MKRALSFLRTLRDARRGRATPPRFLTYIVTFTCNARCIMCDSWRKPSPNDLTLDEIDRIFGELPRMDAVRLTGGEPFVRKDLLDIAHLAQDKLRPLALHVTTNGFLTDRIVQFCEQRIRGCVMLTAQLIRTPLVSDHYLLGYRIAWKNTARNRNIKGSRTNRVVGSLWRK